MESDSLNWQVFRFLGGSWRIRRNFEGSYSGTYVGEASFVPEPGELPDYYYSEEGKLTDALGQCFSARQNYRYRLAAENVQVFKHEAGEWVLMHELDFRRVGGLAYATHLHLCGEDHYATTYEVDLENERWEMSYQVDGPKKAYRIGSLFKRV